jgi:parvulin-like peptidyl-prolyl isomerase
MFTQMRNHTKIIIYIVIAAFIVTGSIMGFGSYFNDRSTSTNLSSPYIASVNKVNISREDYLAALQSQASQASQLNSSQIIPYRLNVLNTIIERELILQEAKDLNINADISDKDVEDYIKEILEHNQMSEEELNENLIEQDYSLKELKEEIRINLKIQDIIQKTIEQSYSNVSISDNEVIMAYEKVKPSILTVFFNDDKELAKDKIDKALKEIKSGVNFEDVINKYSDSKNEINLSFIAHNDSSLSKDLIDAAFSLNPGEYSNIITGEEAYYIIKLIDKKEAKGKDFEEEKDTLKTSLLEDKQSIAFRNWLDNLKAESKIDINDPNLSGYEALIEQDYKKAIKDLNDALKINPVPSIYIYLAEAYSGNKELTKAKSTFEKAIEQYPDDWQLRLSFGSFYSNNDENDKALVQYDKASELAGDDFMAHYQLYMLYSYIKEDERASLEETILNEIQKKLMEEEQETVTDSESTEDNKTEE